MHQSVYSNPPRLFQEHRKTWDIQETRVRAALLDFSFPIKEEVPIPALQTLFSARKEVASAMDNLTDRISVLDEQHNTGDV